VKSEQFYCPHCRTKLQMSAAAFVLGETGNADAARQVLPTAACPACGGPIDTKAMGVREARVWRPGPSIEPCA
jgi:hypothetical protein